MQNAAKTQGSTKYSPQTFHITPAISPEAPMVLDNLITCNKTDNFFPGILLIWKDRALLSTRALSL